MGLITDPLVMTQTVFGVDVSKDVYRGAAGPRVCRLATGLPLKSNAFDLVLATQIFEHLTDDDLQAVSREMVRVSRRISTLLARVLRRHRPPTRISMLFEKG